MNDLISRQAAIDELGYCQTYLFDSRDKDKKISLEDAEYAIEQLPSAQPEIMCKDCEYGEQDDIGRWFCSDLGCQMGNEDGSGYCADAERRTDGKN